MKSKIRLLVCFFFLESFGVVANAGSWSASTQITQLGAWGPWFGVVVNDTGAALGCTGSGTKALDISTVTPTKQAQMTLLIAAYTTGKLVKLYYDSCTSDTTVITNVQIVPN